MREDCLPAGKPHRTCTPALCCHPMPRGPPLDPSLLHSPQGQLDLSMDRVCFSTGTVQVLGGQHSSACCGRCSLQGNRKDISLLLVAKQTAAPLCSGAGGAVGDGCSSGGSFPLSHSIFSWLCSGLISTGVGSLGELGDTKEMARLGLEEAE